MKEIKFLEDNILFKNEQNVEQSINDSLLLQRMLKMKQGKLLHIYNETLKDRGNFTYYLINTIKPMNYNADYSMIRIDKETKKSCIFMGNIVNVITCLRNNIVDNSELYVFKAIENDFYSIYKIENGVRERQEMMITFRKNIVMKDKITLFDAFLTITEQFRHNKDISFEIITNENKCLIKI